jgi:hypothetical protein
MTPQERDLLTRFLQDLAQARAGAKDPEAATLISQVLGANPDASYLLVQHTILADQALHAAQARIADLEAQASASQGAQPTSFLGGANPWRQAAAPTAVPATPPPQPTYAPDYGGPFSAGGGLGSFLRNAGTTAAGVAGGELLFEGLSGLFGGHRMFGGGLGGFGGAPQENVVVNNYYDDDRGDQGQGWDNGGYDDGGSYDDGSGGV